MIRGAGSDRRMHREAAKRAAGRRARQTGVCRSVGRIVRGLIKNSSRVRDACGRERLPSVHSRSINLISLARIVATSSGIARSSRARRAPRLGNTVVRRVFIETGDHEVYGQTRVSLFLSTSPLLSALDHDDVDGTEFTVVSVTRRRQKLIFRVNRRRAARLLQSHFINYDLYAHECPVILFHLRGENFLLEFILSKSWRILLRF